MNVLLDATDAPASWANSAFERLPYAALILDKEQKVRFANTEATLRLGPSRADNNPHPAFAAILAASARIPAYVRIGILAGCEAEIHGSDTHGANDALFALSPGHRVAFYIRNLGADRWMVVLEDRRGRGDADFVSGRSHRDALTEIGNRRHFETKLTQALTDEEPSDRPAVVVFDIDRFRSINDRLGRGGGDALLRAVVGRIRRATRECDHVARLEGDTFAVLQYNGDTVDTLAARFVDLLGRPYLVRGEVETIGISVGVARAPEDGITAASLLRHADDARREAKDAGGRTWRRYGQSMADRAHARLELESDLRNALALGQMSLAYQPRMRSNTRAVTGFEARIRWKHPKRGAVPMDVFGPVAEDIGLTGPIGDWALRTACRDAVSWPEPLTVALGVSARQLDDGQHFISQVAGALRESGLPTRRLELGLTEGVLTKRPEQARIVLRDLHELGVRLVMDDFGAGDISLRQLRSFPFDTIKIVASFVRSLDSDDESGAAVRAIAMFGSGLGMTVVADGVETPNQARMVSADGCTELQGNLISEPIPASAVRALLARDLVVTIAT